MQSLTNSLTQSTSLKTPIAQKEPFLVIEDVAKVYPTAKDPYIVVEGINLTVYEGEFVCVIGHSGCGKSTLLNMVAGFSKPTHGEVRLRGKSITKPGPDRMMVFQNYSLLPWKTAFENVYLGVNRAYPEKSRAEKVAVVEEHLAMVGLSEAANKKPSQLSGGMKQRVAIARALAIRPEILILDEPFGALDAITKEELQEELLQIWREHRVTVLMITHDIDEALFLADRVVMMTNGPAAQIGEVLEIPFKRPRVRSQIVEDPRYYELRNHALDFLFCRFAHSEAEPVGVSSTSTVTIAETSTTAQHQAENEVSAVTPVSTTEAPTMTQNETLSPMNARIGSVVTLAAFSVLLLGAWIFQPRTDNAAEAPAPTTSEAVVSTPSTTETAVITEPVVSSAGDATTASPAPMTTETTATETMTTATEPTDAMTASPEATATKITEPAKLDTLKSGVYDKIDQAWQTSPTFTEELVYRLKVDSQGTILSYESVNEPASEFVKETPIESLVTPAESEPAEFAEFKVVLSPAGQLSVEPF